MSSKLNLIGWGDCLNRVESVGAWVFMCAIEASALSNSVAKVFDAASAFVRRVRFGCLACIPEIGPAKCSVDVFRRLCDGAASGAECLATSSAVLVMHVCVASFIVHVYRGLTRWTKIEMEVFNFFFSVSVSWRSTRRRRTILTRRARRALCGRRGTRGSSRRRTGRLRRRRRRRRGSAAVRIDVELLFLFQEFPGLLAERQFAVFHFVCVITSCI